MAVEKITQRVAADLSNIPVTDSDTTYNANSFNNKYVNPFDTKQKFSQGGKTNERTLSNPSKGFLFGNNLVKDEEGFVGEKNELPNQQKASGLGTISNYFKNIVPTFKQVQSRVDDYDFAVNNALKYLPSKGDLEAIVDSNLRIKAILSEANLPVKMNYDNLKTIKQGHIADTTKYTRVIGKEMGYNDSQLQTMEVGAALHDIGKTLIPAEILNKNGKLTDSERKVVNLHSVLGYEILKSAGFGTNVAEIARDHHNPNSQNPMAQVVRAADVYSAMTEERPYKEAKSHEEAMGVLQQMKLPKETLAALDSKYGKTQKPGLTLSNQTLASAV